MPKAKRIEFKINENGCFIVTSHKQSWKGYVPYQRGHKKTRLHRHIYEEMKGPIPKGLVVRHTCDTPNCINPSHLILGTPADNSRDMVERRRQAYGERHSRAVLNEQEVRAIFELLENGFHCQDVANCYGVSRRTIYDIQQGRTWRHLNLKEGETI